MASASIKQTVKSIIRIPKHRRDNSKTTNISVENVSQGFRKRFSGALRKVSDRFKKTLDVKDVKSDNVNEVVKLSSQDAKCISGGSGLVINGDRNFSLDSGYLNFGRVSDTDAQRTVSSATEGSLATSIQTKIIKNTQTDNVNKSVHDALLSQDSTLKTRNENNKQVKLSFWTSPKPISKYLHDGDREEISVACATKSYKTKGKESSHLTFDEAAELLHKQILIQLTRECAVPVKIHEPIKLTLAELKHASKFYQIGRTEPFVQKDIAADDKAFEIRCSTPLPVFAGETAGCCSTSEGPLDEDLVEGIRLSLQYVCDIKPMIEDSYARGWIDGFAAGYSFGKATGLKTTYVNTTAATQTTYVNSTAAVQTSSSIPVGTLVLDASRPPSPPLQPQGLHEQGNEQTKGLICPHDHVLVSGPVDNVNLDAMAMIESSSPLPESSWAADEVSVRKLIDTLPKPEIWLPYIEHKYNDNVAMRYLPTMVVDIKYQVAPFLDVLVLDPRVVKVHKHMAKLWRTLDNFEKDLQEQGYFTNVVEYLKPQFSFDTLLKEHAKLQAEHTQLLLSYRDEAFKYQSDCHPGTSTEVMGKPKASITQEDLDSLEAEVGELRKVKHQMEKELRPKIQSCDAEIEALSAELQTVRDLLKAEKAENANLRGMLQLTQAQFIQHSRYEAVPGYHCKDILNSYNDLLLQHDKLKKCFLSQGEAIADLDRQNAKLLAAAATVSDRNEELQAEQEHYEDKVHEITGECERQNLVLEMECGHYKGKIASALKEARHWENEFKRLAAGWTELTTMSPEAISYMLLQEANERVGNLEQQLRENESTIEYLQAQDKLQKDAYVIRHGIIYHDALQKDFFRQEGREWSPPEQWQHLGSWRARQRPADESKDEGSTDEDDSRIF